MRIYATGQCQEQIDEMKGLYSQVGKLCLERIIEARDSILDSYPLDLTMVEVVFCSILRGVYQKLDPDCGSRLLSSRIDADWESFKESLSRVIQNAN